MKITGYRVEKYIYKVDRGIADANNPSGEDLSMGSLLFLETDEGVTTCSTVTGDNRETSYMVS